MAAGVYPLMLDTETEESDELNSIESSRNVEDDSSSSNEYTFPSSFKIEISRPRNENVLRHAWIDWLKSRHLGDAAALKPKASKRSRSCLMRCLNQGALHPAQCHSLC